jgi:hypothetical protein
MEDTRPSPTQCTLHFSNAAKAQTGTEKLQALSQRFDISVNPDQQENPNAVTVHIGIGTDERRSCTAGFLRIQTRADEVTIGGTSQKQSSGNRDFTGSSLQFNYVRPLESMPVNRRFTPSTP